MKALKFRSALARLILEGKKTTTWRLFDDKDINKGDCLIFIEWDSSKEFAKAAVVTVRKTSLGALTPEDKEGHEQFGSDQEMYRIFEEYYRRPISAESPVTVVKFRLV